MKSQKEILSCLQILIPSFLVLWFLPMVTFAQQTDEGRIIAISPDKDVVKRGDTIKVTVEIQNLQRGQHHQLVVLNILNSAEKAIYDSHVVGEDIDFVIDYLEHKVVGPFSFRVPRDVPPGIYTILVGYREYPWEPLIAFQGASWCPPVKNIEIR